MISFSKIFKKLRFIPAFFTSSVMAFVATVPLAPFWVLYFMNSSERAYYNLYTDNDGIFFIVIGGWIVAAIAATMILSVVLLPISLLTEDGLRKMSKSDYTGYFGFLPFLVTGLIAIAIACINATELADPLFRGAITSVGIGTFSFAHYFHQGIQKLKKDELKGLYTDEKPIFGFEIDERKNSKLRSTLPLQDSAYHAEGRFPEEPFSTDIQVSPGMFF